jgi:serine/threonine protein kinase
MTLIDKNIYLTDLKPENTLFDRKKNYLSIIDLGGAIIADSYEEF